MTPMRIVVAGSSGVLGRDIVAELSRSGHEVVRLVRRPAADVNEITWDPYGPAFDAEIVAKADAVLNLCGAPVAGARWTPAYKAELRNSRIVPTEVLARAVAETGVPVLLNASAAGFYGDTGDQDVDESRPAATDFLGTMCRDWEAATAVAAAAGARVVLLRTSNVLAAESEMITRLRPIFKLGLGGRFGSGTQYLPWISLRDWTAAVTSLLTGTVAGPVNLVAPEAVTNAEFARAFAAALHRPAKLVLPGAVLKLIGGEAGAELLHGHKMRPNVLVANGFEFEHATLRSAFAWAFAEK